MNECTSCGLDFGSVSAFDRHRVGVHEYTFTEGVAMDPPRFDGRRCLAVSEMAELTDEAGSPVFAQNARGLWSIARDLSRARTLKPRSA